MLSIEVIEEFEEYFEKMVPVIEAINKDYYLPEEKAGEYLAGLVTMSENYHLPFASDLAVLKAQMYQYVPEIDGRDRSGGKYERKRKKQYLLNGLQQGKAYADDYFAGTRQLLQESSILLRKVAAVASAKGLSLEGCTEQLIEHMKQDEELFAALTNAIGTVGYSNMKCLLQRAVADVTE